MGNDRQGGLPEHIRQFGTEDTDSHCYGLDRYSWQQGENAKFQFMILEDQEPSLVARGGGCGCICYQDKVGALCATDYKWVQNEQVGQNKLIICKRSRTHTP